ncbi:MAG: hypothetical protein BM557_05060 [Flavobacterium sp. MedPE-SWcel]|uniref:hypothetical protein n=1 Tax=uncultured Flavobacterium sp. TaxID=165435 RepID=UPI00091EAE82|nr:hypothetical protein [uncultured Flavobacterium sp.]OIQ21124.1 MAG: hypothetical protein BM557_05060 [Flavobacterium sp. MedPE-SWcel]
MRNFNYFFVGVPAILGLLGFIFEGLWAIAALFMILTGLVQIVSAFVWTFDDRLNNLLKLYWLLTVSFFLMWIFTDWLWIWVLPPCIAIYFTIILHYQFNKN